MYNLDIGFTDSIMGGEIPMAFGDLNNDGYTDIVTISDNSETIRIYNYNNDQQAFISVAEIKNDLFNSFRAKITSIVLHDIDGDNKTELIVTTTIDSANILVFEAQENSDTPYKLNSKLMITQQRKQQPLIFSLYNSTNSKS